MPTGSSASSRTVRSGASAAGRTLAGRWHRRGGASKLRSASSRKSSSRGAVTPPSHAFHRAVTRPPLPLRTIGTTCTDPESGGTDDLPVHRPADGGIRLHGARDQRGTRATDRRARPRRPRGRGDRGLRGDRVLRDRVPRRRLAVPLGRRPATRLGAPKHAPHPPVGCAKFVLVDYRRADVLRASPRMFESDFMDRLSRVHPVVPLVIFIPTISVLFALGQDGRSPLAVTGLLVAGYFFWTLTEYWLHRLVFHFEPEHGIGARLHWIIHGVHHDHPNDPLRLVMPPSVSIPLAFVFYLGFAAVLGTPEAYLFSAGFLAGYL